MSIITESYTKCSGCNKKIRIVSPPLKTQYNSAMIHIHDGMVLLPDSVVEANHQDGYADDHAASLDGYYCGIQCLVRFVMSVLGNS